MIKLVNIKPFVLLLLLTFTAAAQNETLFETGKQAYKEEAYQEAIESWKKILENGQHSAAVYFNLGNAHYKRNEIGPSIYYYEKALQLSPYDSDIKNNLAYAENARVDEIEPLPRTVFALWYDTISGILSFDGWAWTAVIASVLAVGLFLFYFYGTAERKKRLYFVSFLIAIFVMAGSLSMAFMTYADKQKDRPAIIFAESVEVRDSPSVGGEISYIIHEGTKVQLLEEDTDWVRIRLADGKDGWIPKVTMKPL